MGRETSGVLHSLLWTGIWRILVTGFAMVALAACGGGGDDGESSGGWVLIYQTSAQPTDQDLVHLEGITFMGAKRVSWANTSTGESGDASHYVECSLILCLHVWGASIPLAMGANAIQVTASDDAGNSGSDAVTVTRLPESVPPTITSTFPPNGATGIAFDSLITVLFSEDMDGSTISPATVLLEDRFGNRVESAVLSSGRSATLNPTVKLAGSTTYRATVTTGARDLAGNALATAYSWLFTTAVMPDTTLPSVASTTPPNGSNCVAVDGNITATFTEPINAATVTASTLNVMDVNRNPIPGAVSALTTTSFAFTPSSALSFSTAYTATLTTAVKDLSGNPLATEYVWSFQTTSPGIGTWQAISMIGAPAFRQSHSSVWTGTEMIIWGDGNSLTGESMPGARYIPTTNTWAAVTNVGAPSARIGHVAVWTGSEMIIWGGGSPWMSGEYRNDGARYDPVTDTWRPLSAVGAPADTRGATAVWTGTEMLIFGGSCGAVGNCASGARYNPATDSWASISSVGAPHGRLAHSAIWTGSRMIVWGGYASGSCSDFSYGCSSAGGAYDPVSNTWEATSLLGAPSGRSGHTAVWTGSEMAIWGGEERSELTTNSGALYNPQTKTWRAMSTGCAPSARFNHKAIWSGSEMIVWGGWYRRTNANYVSTGSRYDPNTNAWQHLSIPSVPITSDSDTAIWTGSSMIVWRSGYYGTPMGLKYQP